MKTISILGDSYSTYSGWIPADYKYWYTDTGNECENNVSSVEQTWWRKLCKELNLQLIDNCSYSGSTVCNTGYDGADASDTSFIHRMKRELGENREPGKQPDILLVFGATNDYWAGSPIGSPQYENWDAASLKQFAPAFCYLFHYLRKWNPQSKIYSIVNDELSDEYRDVMNQIADQYGIQQVLLHDIEKENGHPNVNGMKEIKNQLINPISDACCN